LGHEFEKEENEVVFREFADRSVGLLPVGLRIPGTVGLAAGAILERTPVGCRKG
jgi:hypothetical protein